MYFADRKFTVPRHTIYGSMFVRSVYPRGSSLEALATTESVRDSGRPRLKRVRGTVGIVSLVLLIASYSLLLSAATAAAQETWVLRDYAVGRYNGTESGGAWMADVLRLQDGTYRMYYGSMLASGLSAIRYAESSDGVTWTVRGTILEGSSSPSDPEYSVSGPSVLRLPDGRFRMYYQSSPQIQ